jgi:hypothetical protein
MQGRKPGIKDGVIMFKSDTGDRVQQVVSVLKEQGFQKGQKVLYEGKPAQVIAVKPILVVRTKDRVICGALGDHLSG